MDELAERLRTALYAVREKPHATRHVVGQIAKNKDLVQALLIACRNDPDLFNFAVLGRSPFWTKQQEMCRLVANHKTSVICSGNSLGKTYWLSSVILWYLFTRPKSIVVTTAPTARQLATVLWNNIREAYRGASITLGGSITDSDKANLQTLNISPSWYAIGLSTTKTEKSSGYHSGNIMVAADEASLVSPEIYAAMDSLVYDIQILVGNPIHCSGRFYDLACKAEDKASGIGFMRISSLESPDADKPSSEYGLANRGWLDEMRVKWGENSLWWQSHIEANFPDTNEATLVPRSWLDLCLVPHVPGGLRRIAVDLALGNGGDAISIVCRDDNGVLDLQTSNVWKFEEVARRVKMMAEKWGVPAARIIFDQAGIGADFSRRLCDVGLPGCRTFNASKTGPATKFKFFNLRAAAGWELRRRLDPTRVMTGPESFPQQFSISPEHLAVLRPELQATRYRIAQKGQILLDHKEMIRERIGKSPDNADALMISFAFKE